MSLQVAIVLGCFVAIWFWLWAVVDVAIGAPGRFRVARRGLWLLVVLLVPVVGAAVYLVAGRYVPAPAWPQIEDDAASPEPGDDTASDQSSDTRMD